MNEHRSMICVGGPRDGERRPGENGRDYFRAAGRVPATVTLTTYVRQHLRTPDEVISFWAPQGQKPHESLRMLLEYYEGARHTARAL